MQEYFWAKNISEVNSIYVPVVLVTVCHTLFASACPINKYDIFLRSGS